MKEIKYIRDQYNNIVSVETKEVLSFNVAKKRFGKYKEWKEFEAKLMRKRAFWKKALITKEEWLKLKPGMRFINMSGGVRWIVRKSGTGTVTLKKQHKNRYRGSFTYYQYTDLAHKYMIYYKKPTPNELKEFKDQLNLYKKENKKWEEWLKSQKISK